eukprot:1127704-Amorphochlora_amoeboformis.AAC.1
MHDRQDSLTWRKPVIGVGRCTHSARSCFELSSVVAAEWKRGRKFGIDKWSNKVVKVVGQSVLAR